MKQRFRGGATFKQQLKDFLTPHEDSCIEGNFEKAKSAFTLAETLIVVAILGVIAVLVIPNLIRNQIESQNRVKVKKAMSVYERALNKIVIENDLRSNTALINYNNSAENANCADTSKYFKASQGQGCMFKTSDGVWWDITNIQRPIIYLNKEGITANNQADVINHATKTNEQEDKDAYKAFILVGRFDDTIGALRINDKAYEDANSVTEDSDRGTSTSAKMAKLYGFTTNAKNSGDAGGGEVCEVTKSCDGGMCTGTDCHGRETAYFYYCDESGNNCLDSQKHAYDNNGNHTTTYSCDGNGNNCSMVWEAEYDDNGNMTAECLWAWEGTCNSLKKNEYDDNGNETAFYVCDGSGNNCSYSEKYEYDDNGNKTAEFFNCGGSGNDCEYSKKYEYDDNGNRTIFYNCDGNGENCSQYDPWL